MNGAGATGGATEFKRFDINSARKGTLERRDRENYGLSCTISCGIALTEIAECELSGSVGSGSDRSDRRSGNILSREYNRDAADASVSPVEHSSNEERKEIRKLLTCLFIAEASDCTFSSSAYFVPP